MSATAKRSEVLEKAVVVPRMMRREVWIELPQEYEGFKAKIWLNPPAGMWKVVWGGEVKEGALNRQETLQAIVLEHNGWRDYDDVPYAPANTKEFWDAIPDELAAAILVACQVEMGKLANSLLPNGRR